MNLEEVPTWVRGVFYAGFAALGGSMGYVMRSIDGNQKPSWWRAAMEGFAAGFVGVIVLLTCQAMAVSEAWTGVIVGVSGWLGANVTIRLLEGIVRKKLGVTSTQTETPNANGNE